MIAAPGATVVLRDDLAPFPVPYRITQALDACELYGPEVDRACGVEEPMVDLWEAGEVIPTDAQVVLLAALTSMPVEFFYLPCSAAESAGVESLWICDRTKRKRGCQRYMPEPRVCAPLGVS